MAVDGISLKRGQIYVVPGGIQAHVVKYSTGLHLGLCEIRGRTFCRRTDVLVGSACRVSTTGSVGGVPWWR